MENKNLEIKGYAENITKSKDDIYSLIVVGSKEVIDRDNEIVKLDGMDLRNYKKNPVVMWAHQYDQPPIGKTKKVWVEGKELKFKIEFAKGYPFADTIANLYSDNYLSAFSIGFSVDYKSIEVIPEKGKHPAHRLLNKTELLEISCVPVPANPLALSTEKSFEMVVNKECEDGAVEGKELEYLETLVQKANLLANDEKDVGKSNSTESGDEKVDYDMKIKELIDEISSLKEKSYLNFLFDDYKKEASVKNDKFSDILNSLKGE